MSRTITAQDRSALIRLASALPKGSPERRAILAGLAGKQTLTGSARDPWWAKVWAMYEHTYRSIGMHLSEPQDLAEYDLWEVVFDGGVPVAFALYKSTPFGLKSALSGHDGSGAGKSAAVQDLKTKYLRSGVYGEASHKVLDIALSAGAPVVCAAFAPKVLRKDVEVNPENPLEYSRNISGVGRVMKSLIGSPKGIPTTDPRAPSCPVDLAGARLAGRFAHSEREAAEDRLNHYYEAEISEWARRTASTIRSKEPPRR
jgi:hypothetical protein